MNYNFTDMTGWKMNEHGVPDSRWTVKRFVGLNKSGKAMWECECSCDKHTIKTVEGTLLRGGQSKSCGCYRLVRRRKNHGFVDMTGWVMKEHGVPESRLTALSLAEPYIGNDGHKRQQWLCHCECGNEIIALGFHIRKGVTKSCGCYHSDVSAELGRRTGKLRVTHGESNTRLYKEWRGMKVRCNNPTDQHWPDYGGRGIRLCDEWNESYEAFAEWAKANGYDDSLTIDRIDVNGNYEPSNCRWVTQKEQSNNKRTNVYLTYKGETKTAAQWAEEIGMNPITLRRRIQKGWSVEDAIEKPLRRKSF